MPLFSYNYSRDAYVLRGVGRRFGPVLRYERRNGRRGERVEGVERRHTRLA